MTENLPTFVERNTTQLSQLLDKILAAARPGAVFSEPVHSGDYTVITASEVTAGGGFGSGFGSGPAPAGSATGTGESGSASATQPSEAGGGGFGGGGGSHGRPVAVIVIGPDGVRVRPVVDVTKIGLAAVTTWLAMFMMFRRLRRLRRGRRRPMQG
ncbi:MAG TPA: hypothetical protein VNL16_19265 [Chloroflexota bacterium]|nr:hypothetical protein [Chloroflexota bacterium]